MSTGPETVPPGRSSLAPTSSDTVAPPEITSSTTHLVCGNSETRNAAISSFEAMAPTMKGRAAARSSWWHHSGGIRPTMLSCDRKAHPQRSGRGAEQLVGSYQELSVDD